MKTTIAASLALVLLAGTASATLAQDHRESRREHRANSQSVVRHGGGERPRARNTEPGDARVERDRSPPAAPKARPAPSAVQAPRAHEPRAQTGGGERQGFRDDASRHRDRRGDGDRGDRRGGGDHRDRHDRNGSDRHDWNRGGEHRDWNRGGDHRGGDRHDWRGRGDRHGQPRWERGRYPPVYRSHQRFHYGRYRPPAGFYAHSWGFGDILPRGWWGSDYLLNDWWDYGLPYPPPGYDWVRVGDDAMLIDSFTGRVVQVVRYIFW